MSAREIDLGNGLSYSFVCYKPDRRLNPNSGPDIDPIGIIINHEDGCTSCIYFDLPGVSEITKTDVWTVVSMDPLHVEPSILRSGAKNGTDHDHHGWIRGGKWEFA